MREREGEKEEEKNRRDRRETIQGIDKTSEGRKNENRKEVKYFFAIKMNFCSIGSTVLKSNKTQ